MVQAGAHHGGGHRSANGRVGQDAFHIRQLTAQGKGLALLLRQLALQPVALLEEPCPFHQQFGLLLGHPVTGLAQLIGHHQEIGRLLLAEQLRHSPHLGQLAVAGQLGIGEPQAGVGLGHITTAHVNGGTVQQLVGDQFRLQLLLLAAGVQALGLHLAQLLLQLPLAPLQGMAIQHRQDLIGHHSLVGTHQHPCDATGLIALDQGVVAAGAHHTFGPHGLLKRQHTAHQQDHARSHQHALADGACPGARRRQELIDFGNHQRPSVGLHDGVFH